MESIFVGVMSSALFLTFGIVAYQRGKNRSFKELYVLFTAIAAILAIVSGLVFVIQSETVVLFLRRLIFVLWPWFYTVALLLLLSGVAFYVPEVPIKRMILFLPSVIFSLVTLFLPIEMLHFTKEAPRIFGLVNGNFLLSDFMLMLFFLYFVVTVTCIYLSCPRHVRSLSPIRVLFLPYLVFIGYLGVVVLLMNIWHFENYYVPSLLGYLLLVLGLFHLNTHDWSDEELISSLLPNLVECAREGYAILNHDGQVKYVNPFFKEKFELPDLKQEDNLAKMLDISLESSEEETLRTAFTEALGAENSLQTRFFYGASGKLSGILLVAGMDEKTAEGELEAKREVTQNYLMLQDQEASDLMKQLSEETDVNKNLDRELKSIHRIDPLTSLPNYEWFASELSLEINKMKEKNADVWIVVYFLNLDGFRLVNQSKGMGVGDAVLVAVSDRIRKVAGEQTFVARYAEDEFLMFETVYHPDKKTADTKAAALINAFREPFGIEGENIFVGLSFGVACYPEDGTNAMDLVHNAEMAKGKAKSIGRNSYYFCNTAVREEVARDFRVRNDLIDALENHKLELYYQPQVDMRSGRVVGKEAFLRLNHEKFGLMKPATFISAAEKYGVMKQIDDWVLREACRQNVQWLKEGAGTVISVNVSKAQFEEGAILANVEKTLEETLMPANLLELEITENVLLDDMQGAIEMIKRLKTLGIRISIDDFGTEYSSLRYLKDLPVDRIKISASFVNGISTSPIDEAIIDALIVLTERVGIEIIAEGVEEHEQMTYLRNNGCRFMQGYYFYEPMNVETIEHYKILSLNNDKVL